MQRTPVWPNVIVGIIGGGQLAKMMVQKGKKLGFTMHVLDPSENSSAGQLADREVVGSFHDRDALARLAAGCDFLTYDIEHIDTGALLELEAAGHRIHPAPHLLGVIQDKLAQRRFFAEAGVPQPRFVAADTPDEETRADFGYPLVQKLRRGGYDGRGVAVLHDPDDEPLSGPSLLEELVPIRMELAVMVARGQDGDLRAYPPVEMEFDARTNILDFLVAPARVEPRVAAAARDIAVDAVRALGGVGIFGVELFLDRDDRILLNEVAPRPHNSGHYTFEACVTSQFEQHLRAVVGLPLGSTEQMRPAVTLNLLGEPDAAGRPRLLGLEEALAIDGVSVHVYGKAETRPHRKMGHVTVLDTDIERAHAKALEVRSILRMTAEESHE